MIFEFFLVLVSISIKSKSCNLYTLTVAEFRYEIKKRIRGKNNFTSGGEATYNSAPMSKCSRFQRLPVEVDPFRLVEQRRVLDGRIPLGDFSRLAESLIKPVKSLDLIEDNGEVDQDNNNNEGIVFVHLDFTRTDTGLPMIKGNIHADLDMLCQRCLQTKTEPFKTDFEVVLVTSDEQAERIQEGFDTWFVEDQKIFLLDFIEDEILLALPLAVAHDDCKAERELIEAGVEDFVRVNVAENAVAENAEVQQENPFAVLKDLKLKS